MKTEKKRAEKHQFVLLKEKLKYFLSIRTYSSVEDEESMMHAAGNTTWKISKTKGFIKTTLKRLSESLPERVMFNMFTTRVFGVLIFLLDWRINTIQKKLRSNLILFNEPVAQLFMLPDPGSRPEVTIIIPVHNKYSYTHKCLWSIKEHSGDVKYEVIIADDASSDETLAVADRIGNVRVVRNGTSLGFLGNCNRAAEFAKGKFVLFLNNDTVVQPGWLQPLLNIFEKDKKCGLTGSKLVYPQGLLQEAGGIIWQDGSGWNYGRLGPSHYPEFSYVKECDYISGAAIMIRKTLWEEIGGFDKRYTPAYYEDADLAFEVRKRGYKVIYQPQSVVVHFEGISHGVDLGSGIKQYQALNQEKFTGKWKEELKLQCKDEKELFLARDRSAGKKGLLFIDHYPPEYDKDAGSKTCFEYLKLFTEMGFNVKFMGDNFIRREPYTSALQQMGIEVLNGYWYHQNWREWALENNKYIDYVFINRPHITSKHIDFLSTSLDAKIIYYGHDLHHLREQRQYELEKNDDLLRSVAYWKKIETDAFAKSDLVLYPSVRETEEVKKIDASINTAVLQPYLFENPAGFVSPDYPGSKHDLLFVGGFNHPPNADAVLWFAKEIFPLIRKEIPEVRFIVVGSRVPEEIMALSSESILIKGFVSEEVLVHLYRQCRIVVAPLRYGAGVKGKIVEALYYRSAIVTTEVGIEGISNDNRLVAVADDAASFAEAVVALYRNDEERRRIYSETPAFIASEFSKASAEKMIRHHMPQ